MKVRRDMGDSTSWRLGLPSLVAVAVAAAVVAQATLAASSSTLVREVDRQQAIAACDAPVTSAFSPSDDDELPATGGVTSQTRSLTAPETAPLATFHAEHAEVIAGDPLIAAPKTSPPAPRS